MNTIKKIILLTIIILTLMCLSVTPMRLIKPMGKLSQNIEGTYRIIPQSIDHKPDMFLPVNVNYYEAGTLAIWKTKNDRYFCYLHTLKNTKTGLLNGCPPPDVYTLTTDIFFTPAGPAENRPCAANWPTSPDCTIMDTE